jgi:hypothetical protein
MNEQANDTLSNYIKSQAKLAIQSRSEVLVLLVWVRYSEKQLMDGLIREGIDD